MENLYNILDRETKRIDKNEKDFLAFCTPEQYNEIMILLHDITLSNDSLTMMSWQRIKFIPMEEQFIIWKPWIELVSKKAFLNFIK